MQMFPLALLALSFTTALPAAAQQMSEDQRLAEQRAAMAKFATMDGVWRGDAIVTLPDGTVRKITQTERIGPFLGGSVKVIEGRGYDETGAARFDAFGTIWYDPSTQAYTFHSYAQSYAGDFPFKPTADGYVWTIPAGPASIRYTATIKDQTFREIGERIVPGADPVKVFESNLRRIGDSRWPENGSVPPR